MLKKTENKDADDENVIKNFDVFVHSLEFDKKTLYRFIL